jgi:hypothetical protein
VASGRDIIAKIGPGGACECGESVKALFPARSKADLTAIIPDQR